MEHIRNDFEAARRIASQLLESGGPLPEDVARGLHAYGEVDLKEGWRGVKGMIGGRRNRRLVLLRRIAAVVLPVAAAAAVFLLRSGGDELAVVEPGAQSATLVLPSGERVDLGRQKGAVGERAVNDETIIFYNQVPALTDAGAMAAEPVRHTVEVPLGGEYRLRLADGSLVHLNSLSSVRFPTEFTGATREVELTGEAWFEVERDNAKPFIVHTRDYDITVLGTEFNVSAYDDDRVGSTTLVGGSVRIATVSGEEFTLRPDERFTISDRGCSVEQVDASYAASWRTGRLTFRDQPLEDIMRTLGRWYGVEVEYADPMARGMRFGMSIQRQDSIDPVLAMIRENGEVDIRRQGNRVVIDVRR